jgi:hypothetical protein
VIVSNCLLEFVRKVDGALRTGLPVVNDRFFLNEHGLVNFNMGCPPWPFLPTSRNISLLLLDGTLLLLLLGGLCKTVNEMTVKNVKYDLLYTSITPEEHSSERASEGKGEGGRRREREEGSYGGGTREKGRKERGGKEGHNVPPAPAFPFASQLSSRQT